MANRYVAYVRFEVLEFEAGNENEANEFVSDLMYKLGDCAGVPAGTWDNVSWDVLEHPDNEPIACDPCRMSLVTQKLFDEVIYGKD